MEALAREMGLEVVAREAAVMAPEAMVWEVAAAARTAVAARAVFPMGGQVEEVGLEVVAREAAVMAPAAMAREVGVAKAREVGAAKALAARDGVAREAAAVAWEAAAVARVAATAAAAAATATATPYLRSRGMPLLANHHCRHLALR